MRPFPKQDWQAVFTKAVNEMNLGLVGVIVLEDVDNDFIYNSSCVTHVISNSETEHSVLGADYYLARPLIHKMLPANTKGKTLVITHPSIRVNPAIDTIFNVVLRFAFITSVAVPVVIEVESEEDRIAREEEEELAELQRLEDLETAEKERLKKEQEEEEAEKEKARLAVEEQLLKDEAAEKERLALLNKGDDDFPEEDLNKPV